MPLCWHFDNGRGSLVRAFVIELDTSKAKSAFRIRSMGAGHLNKALAFYGILLGLLFLVGVVAMMATKL